MDEYVDVFSDKWTKRLKIFGYTRAAIRFAVMIIFCITLVVLYKGLSPYITGEAVWDDMPFTLSQLEALMSLLIIAYLMKNAIKVI